MKGYEVIKQLRTLTPEQLDNWMQFFWSKVGCDLEGFENGEGRSEFPYAKYVATQADESFRYIAMREDLPSQFHGHCLKHGCNLEQIARPNEGGAVQLRCPMCIHEADRPSDELTTEQLQALHRGESVVRLVPTGDSIENQAYDPPEVTQWKSGMGGVPYNDGDGGPIPSAEVVAAYEAEQLPPIRMCPYCREITSLQRKDANGNAMCELCYVLSSADAKAVEHEMIDGLKVSKDTLFYHLIPEIAIQRLCERIMLGEQTKGKNAWNALAENQSVLDSRKALARRFGHGINHSYRLLGKIQRNEEWTEEDEKEASAVMWTGMYAICAIHQQREDK